MKKILCFAALFSITSFSFATDKESTFLKEAKTHIKDQMKDPDSTQFRNMRIISNTIGEKAVCGEVNAKNSYGGYTGFKAFAYTQQGLSLLDGVDATSFIYERRYNLAGCNGKEKETLERNLLAYKENLAKNPQVFQNYCTVAYSFYTDVIGNNTPKETALEKTMQEYKDKKLELLNPNLEDAKNKFLISLNQVEQLPVAVKAIKKKDKKFETQYLSQCITQLKYMQPI